MLKPELSHVYRELVGVKWTRVDSTEEALRAYAVARSHSLEVVLQELIPGDEQCGAVYNSYFWDGEPLVEFTSRKIRNSPPDTGSPSVVVSEWMPEVAEQGRRLLRAAKFSGYSCTEFKRDPRDGRYKVMEVNARHNLSSLLATRCGLNFPWMQYQHLVDGIVPVAERRLRAGHLLGRRHARPAEPPALSPAARLFPGRVPRRPIRRQLRLRGAGPPRCRAGSGARARHPARRHRQGPEEGAPERSSGRRL